MNVYTDFATGCGINATLYEGPGHWGNTGMRDGGQDAGQSPEVTSFISFDLPLGLGARTAACFLDDASRSGMRRSRISVVVLRGAIWWCRKASIWLLAAGLVRTRVRTIARYQPTSEPVGSSQGCRIALRHPARRGTADDRSLATSPGLSGFRRRLQVMEGLM